MQALKKTRQEVIAEFRAGEILEAACKVFARKGFEAASVDEIAATARLAKGTVYVYFHSKRELYQALLKQGMATQLEETRRAMDQATTVAGKIRAFIGARVRYAEENRDSTAVCHAEFGSLHPACRNKEFKSLYWQQIQAVEKVIREASAQGEIQSVPADTTALLICEMTQVLIGRRLLGWSRASADADIQFLFDLVWNGLAGIREPDRVEETRCLVPGQC